MKYQFDETTGKFTKDGKKRFDVSGLQNTIRVKLHLLRKDLARVERGEEAKSKKFATKTAIKREIKKLEALYGMTNPRPKGRPAKASQKKVATR